MSQKPDYYAVLGVDKKASVDDIKSAFKKIAMKCHPDMLRNKTAAEKAAAGEKFQLAKEANEVLTDPSKRATYDQYGHQGIENLKISGGTSGSSSGGVHMPARREAHSADDTFAFFDSVADKMSGSTPSPPPGGETAEQRRERNAEQRRKARQGSSAAPPVPPPVTDSFRKEAEKLPEAMERPKEVVLPLDALQRFRDNLQDFLQEIDAAIDRSRKNSGPGSKP